MENIIYEEEEVSENVFEGELSLEQDLTLQQQNERVFEMMQAAGMEVGDKSEYRIGYVELPPTDENNASKKYHFVVTRTYKKEVPYKETREEVYSGIWILDGLPMTPEQQRQKVLEMMKNDGVDVSDEETLEIGYVGADDNDGLSETQISKFVVYKVKKEKLSLEEITDLENETALKNLYDEFVALREKMTSASNATEMAQLSEQINNLSKKMDELVAESTRDYGPFETALAEIETQIEAIREIVTKKQREYEASYERIQKIIEEYSKLITESTNVTEYDKKIQTLIERSKAEHEQSLAIRAEIEKATEELKALLKRKKKIESDLKTAQQLGLSAQEYQELSDGFKKRKLITAIIEKKGLGDLVAIPDKERTPEQKRQIKAIRQEIKEELAKAKREKPKESILSLVEALYGIETEVKLRGKQRILIVRPATIETIKQNARKMPEKIKTPETVDKSYKPGEAPEDMREVMENRQEPIIDQFVFFIDDNYPDKFFARANVFERFNIEEVGPAVHINGTLCYEIARADAEQIISNQNNDYSPYIVRIEDGTLEERLEIESEKEKVYDLVPTTAPKKGEILSSQESDEFIPGTTFKRPRVRRNDETDEEYVAFLKDYYGRIFSNTEDALSSETSDDIPPVEEEDTLSDTGNTGADTDEEEDTPSDTGNAGTDADEEEDIPSDTGNAGADTDEEEDTPSDTGNAGTDADEEEDTPSDTGNTGADTDEEEDTPSDTGNAGTDADEEEDLTPPTDETGDGTDENNDVSTEEDENQQDRGATDIVTIFRDADDPNIYYAYKPVFTRFDVEKIGEEVRLDNIAGYEMSPEDVEYIMENANNDYSPYQVEFRTINVQRRPQIPQTNPNEDMESRGVTDIITIFRDANDPNVYYAYKSVFTRFDVEKLGEEVRLNGIAGYEISIEDVAYILDNQDNDYSPYEVVFDSVDLGRRLEPPEIEPIVQPTGPGPQPTGPGPQPTGPGPQPTGPGPQPTGPGPQPTGPGPQPTGPGPQPTGPGPQPTGPGPQPTGPGPQPTGPGPQPTGPGPQPTGPGPQPTGPGPQPTGPGPQPTGPGPQPTGPGPQPTTPGNIEYITLYRDLNDNNQVYAPDDVMRKFGVTLSGLSTDVNGVPCHKISKDTDQIINSIARTSKNPKLEVRYVDVHIKQITPPHARPHVEEILDRLTDGLDIRAKDAKHYQASNLRISKGFRDELHSGNYVYNIVHVVPAVLKAGVSVFRKLAGKLMTGKRAKQVMQEIENRLANLSDEELEVLFEEYKGSQLKTDMNNQINPLILDRLRQYGMAKVAKLNEAIKQDYIMLFTLLGQIKALEEQIQNNGGNNPTLEAQRKALLQQASQHVQSIIENRNKANNILSSGVHGIEEDFKAVATKLSYVGMRFAKTNDFDNELQHKLGEYGHNLNEAIANGDSEAIVQNFMGLESCYYENTQIRGSIVGRRSVGSKYYSPVAEQFDYRDDPFIRDLFTTVAVTSAAISAVNAIRVHQLEAQRVLDDQRQQANSVNAANQSTMNTVHQTGQQIAGKRSTFQEGMEAQAEHGILEHADVRERAHLDLTNWEFNRLYRVTDDAGHAAYNQFGADVTSQINTVTSNYAQGVITQAQALEQIAQISNNAQNTLQQVVDSSLQILRPYAATHPQFDLTAVEQSMSYIVAHPNAVIDMNNAMVDVTNMADGLQALQATPFAALSTLPSDMTTTIIGAASAAVLAANVSATMSRPNRKGRYGNEITQMMDDYLSEQPDPQQTRTI